MPKKAKELTALDVKRIAHSGKGGNQTVAVGGVSGLLMQLAPSGAKTWLLRATVGGKRREIGLGGYPDVTLSDARTQARELRQRIREGHDPVEERKTAKATIRKQQRQGRTFAEAMNEFLIEKLKEFSNDKHRKQWRATLDNYAIPSLGDMPVGDIDVGDVKAMLAPIWTTKTETASRLRGRVEMVLAFATVQGYRSGDNPARWKGNLDAILPKASKVSKVTHHAALQLQDVKRWFADVQTRQGTATRALEFMAQTAARSGEIRGMTWGEVDLDARIWTIPADRMKAGKEHRVTLTTEEVRLLQGLDHATAYVFPAPKGGMLSDAALSACMKRIHAASGPYVDRQSGRPAVPHGLRSTFRDWTAENGIDRDLAEISLAHTVGNEVERAYRRSDMIERRRAVLESWGRFLRGETAQKVVNIR
ncbi:MAG: integrase arm-type DNA-binding domain-containing protein [Shimia thalassica]|uniref:tyrosine-type recombinase/integrase n=1 Tax=Shimia thalassica TaxID=1715693 RepID=UPI0032977DD4